MIKNFISASASSSEQDSDESLEEFTKEIEKTGGRGSKEKSSNEKSHHPKERKRNYY